MKKNIRLGLFLIEIVALFFITYLCTGEFYNMLCYPWFSSGILLLVLLSLIDQPFFSKDSNIFVNAVTAFIALAVIPKDQKDIIYKCMLYLDVYLLISSYILMWIRKVPSRENNKVIKLFSGINNFFGKPQILFSAFFLWSAIMEFGFNNNKYKTLFFYWVVIILIDTTKVCNFLNEILNNTKNKSEKNALGSIIGVQGKNIFLVKLFPNSQRESINLFDPVELNFKNHSYKGLIIETYILNEEQWVKVLTNKELTYSFSAIKNEGKLKEDILYKLPIPNELEVPFIKSFVGIITDNSKIDKIFFTYDSKVQIESGYLLEVKINNKNVIYQIIDGITKQELLEAKNKSGFIIAEAIQLGVWDSAQNRFLKFGWVPDINTPVHIIPKYPITESENDVIKIGTIPNSNLPIYMDIEKAISHHLAVLGVTGTGKSVFVRYLLNQYIKKNNKKVFIFDFTGEHKKKINKYRIFMPTTSEKEIYDSFSLINKEMDKFANQRLESVLTTNKTKIETIILGKINEFISSPDTLSIVELPDAENTQNVFDYIRVFFKQLFSEAKKHLGDSNFPQICIVLEEAHTIIPEWNTSSEMNNKASQSALNAISQIALQGRKYNVGLLIIAQRTANVSKTVLTQCNSIVSFQMYDKTSMDFLSNYYGDGISEMLPTLKPRQAISGGKAFSSSVPIIFEVPDLQGY